MLKGDFIKHFVRVEWMAFQKAIELMKEAKLDNLYFVGKSYNVGDRGAVAITAHRGEEYFDESGHRTGLLRQAKATDFCLEQEIGEFQVDLDYMDTNPDPKDEKYFLSRIYNFDVFKKGQKESTIYIRVIFAKVNEGDDWKLIAEAVMEEKPGETPPFSEIILREYK